MRKNTLHTLVLVLFIGYFDMNAQNIPFKGKAKILECLPPYELMKVDMLDDDTDFIREVAIKPDTKITDKKGNIVAKEVLSPGTEIELIGEKINYKSQLNEIKVFSIWKGEEVEIDGLLEAFDATTGVAIIDGQKVKIVAGKELKGKSTTALKGQKFDGFSKITLGFQVEGSGERNSDGIIMLDKATVAPNDFDAADRALSQTLMTEFSDKNLTSIAPPTDLAKYGLRQLNQGFVSFGDAQLKLVDNLQVQGYVNYVGNSVVPQWQRDIPDGAEEKLNFRFLVIDNPTFNAFALPNGLIFVHTGLLTMLDNEAQLAAVLGHEVAHVTHEHAKDRYKKQEKRKRALDLGRTVITTTRPNVKGDDLSLALMLASDLLTEEVISNPLTSIPYIKNKYVPGALGFLDALETMPPQTKRAVNSLFTGLQGIASNDHSKDDEAQSDRSGLFYMQQAGYDPREAPKIWKKFMDATGDKNLMDKMNRTAKEWVTTSKMYPYDNPMKAAGDFMVGKMAEKTLDNWFSSHPKAKTRYRSLNMLVATNFAGEDLTGRMVNEVEYKEIKALVKLKN